MPRLAMKRCAVAAREFQQAVLCVAEGMFKSVFSAGNQTIHNQAQNIIR